MGSPVPLDDLPDHLSADTAEVYGRALAVPRGEYVPKPHVPDVRDPAVEAGQSFVSGLAQGLTGIGHEPSVMSYPIGEADRMAAARRAGEGVGILGQALPLVAPTGRLAAEGVENLMTRPMSLLGEAALPARPLNIVKERGGQWLSGDIESANERYLWRPVEEESVPSQEEALDKWIKGPLTKYMKRDMGTKDDPIRALAEKGILHIDPAELALKTDATSLAQHRRDASVKGQTATHPAAKAWEDAADAAIGTVRAKDIIASSADPASPNRYLYREWMDQNPWIKNVGPNTPVHVFSDRPGALGFDHVIDVLSQKMGAGQLRPESLNKMSVAQAVELTHRVNEGARKAMMMNQDKQLVASAAHNGRIGPFISYGDKDPVAWYQYKQGMDPEDVAYGLSVDSCLAGHCVGGVGHGEHGFKGYVPMRDLVSGKKVREFLPDLNDYAKQVVDGSTEIYSLRDSSGRPQVTIEVDPLDGKVYQVKGPENKKPAKKFMPMIQDLIKKQGWGIGGDLENTDLAIRPDGSLEDIDRLTSEYKASGGRPYSDTSNEWAWDLPGDRQHTIDMSGVQRWRKEGKLDRDNGPSVIRPNGEEKWHKNGRLHREDGGPAETLADGSKRWYRNGRLHRDSGPAIESSGYHIHGEGEWYRNGDRLPAPKSDAAKLIEETGTVYEPEKYEYRVEGGKLQRREK